MSTEATHNSTTDVPSSKINPVTLRLHVRDAPTKLLDAVRRIMARNHGRTTVTDGTATIRGGHDVVTVDVTVITTVVDRLAPRFGSPAEYADHWIGFIEANTDATVTAELQSVDVVTRQ